MATASRIKHRNSPPPPEVRDPRGSPPRKTPKPSALRLPLLLALGITLVGGAVWLRSSPLLREPILRGKDVRQLEAAVRAQPNDALAQYYLAKSYYLQHRFAEAQDAYEEAIRLDPRSARARLGLALALYETGKIPEAQQAFERTLEIDKNSAWAEYMLGKVLWLQGNVRDALPHVRRATELDPRSDQAWYALAVCQAQMRNYAEAIAPLRKALDRRETSPQYHTALGEMLVYRGQTEEGRKHYERALELKPDYGPACALMGGFLLRHASGPDDLDRAEELLKRATRLTSNRPFDVWFDLGQVNIQKRRYPEAIKALQEALSVDARDERTYYALANAYRRMGQATKAEQTEAQFRRISALHVRMQDLEARIGHRPNDPQAHLEAARVYRDLGLIDKAANAYMNAVRLKPGSAPIADEWKRFYDAQAARQAAQAKAAQAEAAAEDPAAEGFVFPALPQTPPSDAPPQPQP